ncbi:MAG: hypothetical protein H6707_00135 [Deltaproteobacteria bacterium]|nr:hypothetical protein [Deltaproteobacteria bacterium]
MSFFAPNLRLVPAFCLTLLIIGQAAAGPPQAALYAEHPIQDVRLLHRQPTKRGTLELRLSLQSKSDGIWRQRSFEIAPGKERLLAYRNNAWGDTILIKADRRGRLTLRYYSRHINDANYTSMISKSAPYLAGYQVLEHERDSEVFDLPGRDKIYRSGHRGAYLTLDGYLKARKPVKPARYDHSGQLVREKAPQLIVPKSRSKRFVADHDELVQQQRGIKQLALQEPLFDLKGRALAQILYFYARVKQRGTSLIDLGSYIGEFGRSEQVKLHLENGQIRGLSQIIRLD